jgi:DNA polymerase I
MRRISAFTEIVLCDFEYHYGTGESSEGPPIPVCACALEWHSGREYRLWTTELNRKRPPWAHGRDVLFVSFNALAELGCYIELRWPLPPCILDLLIEYRQLSNGVLDKHAKRDLVSALGRYQLPTVDPSEKEKWQNLIITGGPFTSDQQRGILDYCWTDVEALHWLLPAMLPGIPVDLERPLYRGRYTIAAAVTEYTGIPVDETLWCRFLSCRESVQQEVIAGHPVYDGLIFRLERFADWLNGYGLIERWPRTPTGQVSAEDKTFRRFSRIPEVEALRQTRAVVEQLRTPSFVVRQGRNYFSILPFKAETSRNSTVGCLFQAPASLRGLIQPAPGRGLIYADYCQQEYYIAGYLANDPEMLRLYAEGDPYVAFGVMAGLMPATATKKSHPHERDIAKTVSLAVLYGQWVFSMAQKLGISVNRAEDLLAAHRQRFPRVWG